MKESYVSYPQAVKLKECGFDWECNDCYVISKVFNTPHLQNYASDQDWNTSKIGGSKYEYIHISAPRLDQAQKWLRDVKGISVCVFPERYKEHSDVQGIYRERLCGWDFEIWNLNDEEEYDIPNIGYRESYESALSAGIDAALKLLTEKK